MENDWISYRKQKVVELCNWCLKPLAEHKSCVYRHFVDFSKDYPCSHMEGKREWKKLNKRVVPTTEIMKEDL